MPQHLDPNARYTASMLGSDIQNRYSEVLVHGEALTDFLRGNGHFTVSALFNDGLLSEQEAVKRAHDEELQVSQSLALRPEFKRHLELIESRETL